MAPDSIFSEQWRDCLREQYRYVIRNQDVHTERTLTPLLLRIGFSESELAEIRVEATMRAEDMPDDFVPDMDILEPESVQMPADVAPAVPQEELPAAETDESAAAEMEPVPGSLDTVEVEEAEPEEIEAPADEDDDAPKQLSMF